MVRRRIADAVASGCRRCRALLIAVALAAGLFLAAPADWLVRVDSIQILPSDRGDVVVVSAQRRWRVGAIDIAWAARIDRLPLDSTVGPAETVCAGEGSVTVAADATGPLRMPLRAWVGDPACRPAHGQLHVAHVRWSLRLLGLTKRGATRSVAFVSVSAPIHASAGGVTR